MQKFFRFFDVSFDKKRNRSKNTEIAHFFFTEFELKRRKIQNVFFILSSSKLRRIYPAFKKKNRRKINGNYDLLKLHQTKQVKRTGKLQEKRRKPSTALSFWRKQKEISPRANGDAEKKIRKKK